MIGLKIALTGCMLFLIAYFIDEGMYKRSPTPDWVPFVGLGGVALIIIGIFVAIWSF